MHFGYIIILKLHLCLLPHIKPRNYNLSSFFNHQMTNFGEWTEAFNSLILEGSKNGAIYNTRVSDSASFMTYRFSIISLLYPLERTKINIAFLRSALSSYFDCSGDLEMHSCLFYGRRLILERRSMELVEQQLYL